jgi:hypothetical protein
MPKLQMMKQQHLITNWDNVWEKNMEVKFMELLYNIFILFFFWRAKVTIVLFAS